jgi:hypothetical protein
MNGHPHSLTGFLAMNVFVLLLLASAPASAARNEAKQLFEAANQAYDRGEYEVALQDYRNVIAEGYSSMETWYNAANAAFRGGSVGDAVLYYRRAWYHNPRDPDVLANMNLARQRTGASMDPENVLDRAARELSHAEWTRLLMVAYGITLVGIAIAMLFPSMRRFLKPVILIAGTATLVSLGGWFHWRQWSQPGEAVVRIPEQTALYEPRESATPYFALPEGSIVRIEDTFDSWVKVRAGEKSGWVPQQAMERVYPWQGGD